MGSVIGFPLRDATDGTIAPQVLCRTLARDSDLIVLDVRGIREFFSGPLGRLPTAINVPLALLVECIPELVSLRTRRLVLVCNTGTHAERAARRLRMAGFRDVATLRGGMALWTRLGYPRQLPPISRTVA